MADSGSFGDESTSAGVEGDKLVALAVEVRPGGVDAPGVARCSWTLVDATPVDPLDTGQVWPHIDVNGVIHHLYHKVCLGVVDVFVDVPERNPIDLVALAERDLKDKLIPKPVADYQVDPRYGWAYVRMPFDFRVTADSWREIPVTARAGPVWVTVTAKPVSLMFESGDPTWYANPPVTCGGDGPLAPYLDAIAGQCSYVYKDSSAISPVDHYHFDTRLTTNWSITWVASTGASGVLAPFASSSNTLLAVAEIQALTICTGPQPEQGGC